MADIRLLIQEIAKDPNRLDSITPREFEEVVAELLAGFGWQVSLTPPSKDGGYDILAVSKDGSGLESTWIVECKRYDPAKMKVGVEIARGLYGVKSFMGVSNALLATTSSFTGGTVLFAGTRYNMQLADRDKVLEWVRRYEAPAAAPLHLPLRSFHSVFISYSTEDEEFVSELAARLRGEGVRVWFAPDDVLPGSKLHEQIDRAIRSVDRLLVVLSGESMKSQWVMTELRKARKREVEEGRQILFPIALAPLDEIREWECFDADTGKDIAVELREYFIPNFSNWRDPAQFEQQMQRLIRGLQA
jgi:hypothetical protein